MSLLTAIVRLIKPLKSSEAIRADGTLRHFVWRASGMHQFYVGGIAISVALLNFIPIELQRRIVDIAVADKDVRALLLLGGVYLATIVLYSGAKYVLMIYQGWVGESAIKTGRDQLAVVACRRQGLHSTMGGRTANIIGNEIDPVGGFVGTSISEFVVNASTMIVVASYMLYVQPVIALAGGVSLLPQVVLAFYMQTRLNTLVERQVTLVRKLGDEAVDHAPSRAKMLHGLFRTIRTIFSNRIELYLLKFGLKTLLNITNAIGSLLVLIVGGYLVIKGQTTIGTVVAFISGFQRLADPMGDLLDFYRTYSQSKIQYRMIAQWIGTDPAAEITGTAGLPGGRRGFD